MVHNTRHKDSTRKNGIICQPRFHTRWEVYAFCTIEPRGQGLRHEPPGPPCKGCWIHRRSSEENDANRRWISHVPYHRRRRDGNRDSTIANNGNITTFYAELGHRMADSFLCLYFIKYVYVVYFFFHESFFRRCLYKTYYL